MMNDLLNPAPAWTRKDLTLVAILTATALALRIIGLNEELWFDEINTLLRYVRPPAWEIFRQFDTLNNHILYSLAAHFSIGWFGESAWSVRLPAVVFGVATIPAAYYLGRQLMGRNEAFLASAFLAFSYHHVWFSQSARGYTGLLLGTVLISIFFVRLLTQDKPDRRSVLAYAIVAALASWIHLTAALVIIAHGITWLAVISAKAVRGKAGFKPAALLGTLLAGLFSLALYAPVLIQLLSLFGGSEGGAPSPTPTAWRSANWTLAEVAIAMKTAIPGGWPVISIGLLALAAGTLTCLKRGIVVTGILILPVLSTLVFVNSFFDVFFPRFLFNSMVFFLLIAVHGGFVLCRVILPMISTRLVTAIGLTLALASAALVPGAWKPKQDFTGALEFLNGHRAPGDAVVCPGLTRMPLQRYVGMDCIAVFSANELGYLEETHSRTWVLYSFPEHFMYRRPGVWQKLLKEYHRVATKKGTIGGGDIVIMLNSPEFPALENRVIDDS
jgi:uncharacterized membrane protein